MKCAKITDLFKQSVSDNEASDRGRSIKEKQREQVLCHAYVM